MARELRRRERAARAAWARSDGRTALIRSPAADVACAVAGKRLLHCFGDSHVGVLSEVDRRRLLPGTWFDANIVGGATALGLANPNSRTAALPLFERAIRQLPRHRHLLFMLGEVDCGFVIWHRARTKGVSPEDELERSLSSYCAFLDRLLADGRERLIVAAAPPPTILDGQDWSEVANLRREITARLRERTDLTLEYNGRLRRWSAGRGVSFLDYEGEVLDETSRVVAREYRNPSPRDHHLAPGPFAPVIARHLRAAGFS